MSLLLEVGLIYCGRLTMLGNAFWALGVKTS